MTYAFNIYYLIDSDIPGDPGKRTKTVYIDAENEDDAYEYACDKYSNDSEYVGMEIIP